MAKSYNGWPASKNPASISINPDWAPLGHKFPGGVRSGPVEVVFTYLVEQLHKRVEPIDATASGEWGYVYKQSANSPNLLSCHSSGTAIDYNAPLHPNGKRGTWKPAQVAEIRRILHECKVIRWLGDARGKPDEMHFEIDGTAAEVAAAADEIRRNQGDDMANEGAEILKRVIEVQTTQGRHNDRFASIEKRLAAIEAALKNDG